MHTLKFALAIADDISLDLQLRLSANDTDCDMLISFPTRPRSEDLPSTEAGPLDAVTPVEDDCVLGDYAGI